MTLDAKMHWSSPSYGSWVSTFSGSTDRLFGGEALQTQKVSHTKTEGLADRSYPRRQYHKLSNSYRGWNWRCRWSQGRAAYFDCVCMFFKLLGGDPPHSTGIACNIVECVAFILAPGSCTLDFLTLYVHFCGLLAPLVSQS